MAIAEIHTCAAVMLESSDYIKKELPNVTMSDDLRAETLDLCETFVGTWFDMRTEIREIDELYETGEATPTEVNRRLVRAVRWMWDDCTKANALVEKLRAAQDAGVDDHGAYILVAESVLNVLTAWAAARDAVHARAQAAGPTAAA